jgi:hypothetical protein
MVSGVPTEDELQDQWRKAIDLLEQARVFFDSLAGAGQEFDVLMQALEGEFTPDALSNWATRFRAGASSLIDPNFIFDAIAPCILEYGQRMKLDGDIGSGYETVEQLKVAIYERFANGSERVETRALTLDTTGTVTGTGNGNIARLIEDENGYAIENVHTEIKKFRCRDDQTSGTKKNAELFEFVGETRSRDNLLAHSFGSGAIFSQKIGNRNAGTGQGGSLLRNSSFQDYDAAAANNFTNWEKVSGTEATQSTATHYTTFPGNTSTHSMLMAAAVRYKQSLVDMRVNRLKPFRPYFLRAMINRDDGPGAQGTGGNFVLHCGSKSETFTLAGLTAGWNEVFLTLDKNLFFKNFNQDDFNIEIEWTGFTSGDLLVDDLIFCEFDDIDGTYWVARMNDATPTPWKVDDEIAFTDSQADVTAGKINYYLFRADLGYLPHATGGDITFADP